MTNPNGNGTLTRIKKQTMKKYMHAMNFVLRMAQFHKSAGGANHWTFGRLEKDHGRIAINKDGATATFTIEGTTFKCKLKNQKLMEN